MSKQWIEFNSSDKMELDGKSIDDSFYNREKPISAFDELLSKCARKKEGEPFQHRIFNLHGEGGIGKSYLCQELKKRIDERQDKDKKLIAALLDFEDKVNLDAEQALLRLRQDEKLCRHVRFSTFDVAYTELFQKVAPGADIRVCHPYLHKNFRSELIEDLLDLAGNIPIKDAPAIFPGVGILFGLAGRLTGHSLDWWNRRGTKHLVNEMKNLRPHQLRDKLPYYMGRDISQAIEEDDELQIILLLDKFEAFSIGEMFPKSIGTTAASKWIETLIKTTPGTLVAIFGREEVEWSDYEGLNASTTKYPLENFSESTASDFLIGAGIRDEAIRRRIIAGAQGIPQYLTISREDYWNRKQKGLELDPEDFGGSKEEIVNRFLNHLSQWEQAEVLIASYPEVLDEELFFDIIGEILGSIYWIDWKRLTGRSFIEVDPAGRARMRRRMKEHMQAVERSKKPRQYKAVHTRLFTHYEAIAFNPTTWHVIDETNDLALKSAAYHLSQADPDKLRGWFSDPRFENYYHAERWSALLDVIALFTTNDAVRLKCTAKDLAYLYHHRGHIYQKTGDFSSAALMFESALKEQERQTEETEPSTHQALAEVLLELEIDLKEAENHFWLAYTKYNRNAEHIGPANCLMGVVASRKARGMFGKAASLMDEALEIYRKHVRKDDSEYITFLRKMHDMHSRWEEFDHAACRLEEAKEILEAEDRVWEIEYAAVLTDLAACPGHRIEGDRAEHLRDLVETCDQICGGEHPITGRSLYLKIKHRCECDSYGDDDIDQLQRCYDVLECALGLKHEWTIASRELLNLLTSPCPQMGELV